MIESKKNWKGYKNKITEYLDRYLIKCEGCVDFYSNYIYDSPHGNLWIIRVPGASRGNIEIVNGIVTNITLYEDSFCYEREVLDDINQFIGEEIDLGRC